MTPEGRIKKLVNAQLTKLGATCWYFMPVQTGYGRPSLDYMLCVNGRFVAIETKRPGGKLTAMQLVTKDYMERAGGLVLVVDSEESLKAAMKRIRWHCHLATEGHE